MAEPVTQPPADSAGGGIADEDISRRNFMLLLLGVAGSLGIIGIAAPITRYLYPVTRAEVFPKLEVANAADLQPLGEAAYFDYLEAPAGLILLEDGTPKAFYLACTHFGCITKWMPDDQIWYCPCHAGEFAPDGAVTGGPPPKPLVELKVVDEGGTLFVEGTVS